MRTRRSTRRYAKALAWELDRLALDVQVLLDKCGKVRLVGDSWGVRVDAYKALVVLSGVSTDATYDARRNALTAVVSLAE